VPLNCVRYIVDAEELSAHSLSPEVASAAANAGVLRGIEILGDAHKDDEWDVEICIEANEALKEERQLEMAFEMTADWSVIANAMKVVRSSVAEALAAAGSH
jgi:hypothetical protein